MTHRTLIRAGTIASLGVALGLAVAAIAPRVAPALAQDSLAEKLDRLVEKAASSDDAVREQAEREIFGLGRDARTELERIARSSDPKVSMLATRLMASPRWDLPPAAPRPGEELVRKLREAGEAARNSAEDLRQSAEQQLHDAHQLLSRKMSAAQGEWLRSREEIMRRMEEMRRSLTEKFGRDGGSSDATSVVTSSGTSVSNGSRIAWTIDAKGAVKVTTQENGGPETTIEAGSMDALRETHPDLAKRLEALVPRNGGGGSWTLRMPEFRWDEDEKRLLEEHLGQVREPAAGATARHALGVALEPVPDVLREHLELPPCGFVVREVIPGTLAANAGIAPFDIVLRIGGADVSGTVDVRRVLDGIAEGAKFEIEVVRKGKPLTLHAVAER